MQGQGLSAGVDGGDHAEFLDGDGVDAAQLERRPKGQLLRDVFVVGSHEPNAPKKLLRVGWSLMHLNLSSNLFHNLAAQLR